MRVQFIRRPRCEDDAEPLHAGRGAAAVANDPRQANAGVVAGGDEAGQHVELAIGTAGDGRIEHARGLAGVGEVRFHDDAQAA